MWIINLEIYDSPSSILKYLSFIIFFTFLYSQDLEMNPVLEYGYESDSEEYHLENVAVHDFEVGFIGSYSMKKLKIQVHMAYHLIDGMNYDQSKFTSDQ